MLKRTAQVHPVGRSEAVWSGLVDSILRPHRCDKVRLFTREVNNSRPFQKNRNKRSHNTGNGMPEVFINSRSRLVKGSHKSPYVTVLNTLYVGYSEKSKSKARRHSAGQSVNGALAGEQVSNLPVRAQ